MSNSYWVLGLGLGFAGALASCSFPSLGPAPEITAAGSSGHTAGGGDTSGGLGNGGDAGSHDTLGGNAGTLDTPDPKGVAASCEVSADCRVGLECKSKKCAAAHSINGGSTCVISDECVQSTQCFGGTCTPITTEGSAGQGCSTDLDCASGLRCAVAGLSLVCVPEGSADLGAACAAPTACFAGLSCTAGKCAPTSPKPIVTWPGVECDPSTGGKVRAYFEVPGAIGADGDKDFFRLPFPNDALRSSKGLDLSGFPTPGSGLLGSDPVQPYVDAVTANDSAWGSYPTVTFRFSGELNAKTVGSAAGGNFHLTDITPGLKPSDDDSGNFSSLYTPSRSKYVCENWLAMERGHGRPMQPGHTYAFWLSTDIKAKDDSAIERAPNLISLLSNTPPADPKLAGPYAAYEPFRDYIANGAGAPLAAEVLNASVVTVGAIRDPMTELAAAVAAQPAPTTRGWIRCGSNAVSPCPQAEGDRACGTPNAAFDEYQALVSLPIFQKGFPKGEPYLSPADGGDIALPVTAPREDVCLGLTIPKGQTMPDAGWPVVIFAHGTGGSFRSHMTDDAAGVLAKSPTPFAVLGIDQVEHGPRRGKSSESPDNLFFNFLNPKAARGNPLQGAADQLGLLRLVQNFDLTATQTSGAAIKLDSSSVVFFGHSQGSTAGSLAMPYADGVKAVVLSGNGAALKFSLLSKKKPVNISGALPIVLQDLALANPATGEFHPVLSLLQQWIDPADPLNFARVITRKPEAGHTAKNVFETYGLGDTYAPPATLQEYIIAGQLDQITPDDSAAKPDVIGGIKNQPSGVFGNVTIASVKYTLGFREYGPPSGDDGHFVAFDVKSANADVVRFLSASVSSSAAPPIGQ